ncbi:MAG: NADH-quinone oxidoreductase subunit J [Bdellovibrionales bacterium]|nr:NADH-quinone oxidoreductase subunit J [Bdellovibrionales bacterium]
MLADVSTFQIVLGLLTLCAALNVVMAKNPIVSAMSLMATLFTTGALYFGLGQFFIGAVQILIYAGAISVLFVFIVMLLDLRPSRVRIPGSLAKGALLSVGGLVLAMGLLIPYLRSPVAAMLETAGQSAGATEISVRLLTKYMIPFQVTGLLIFAAVIGVIFVGRPAKSQGAS